MGHPDNYYGSIQDPLSAARELPGKIAAVLAGAELLRAEVNRIRNTALALRAPVGRELRAAMGHLQLDLASIEYELTLLVGGPAEKLARAERLIAEPFLIFSNDPSR